MNYDQPMLFAEAQRKQLMWTLAAFFVTTVAAIVFSAIIVSSYVKGNIANALSTTPATQTTPAVTTDASSCVGSTDMSGGGGGADMGGLMQSTGNVSQQGSTIGGHGAGASLTTWTNGGGGSGGSGGGSGGGGMGSGGITGGTFSWTITRNVNSNNAYGSYNGGNTSTVTNTQGSYNTVSGHGDLDQLNLAKNEAETTTVSVVKDSGNTVNSDNNTNSDSHNTTNTATSTNTAVDSGNTTSTTDNDTVNNTTTTTTSTNSNNSVDGNTVSVHST